MLSVKVEHKEEELSENVKAELSDFEGGSCSSDVPEKSEELPKAANVKSKWPCVFCPDGNVHFKTKPQLWQHQAVEHDDMHYLCTPCDLRIRDYKSLRKHKSKVHVPQGQEKKRKANARADVSDEIYQQIDKLAGGKEKTDESSKFQIRDQD